MAEWFASWFDCPYYHILYDNRDDSEAQKFMNNLMREGNYPPSTRILDLACGKGRHSVYLNKLGYQVVGMDLSQASIDEASLSANSTLAFKRHDMRDPFPNGRFHLILNLFTSFGYFDQPTENRLVLQNINHSLEAHGTLVIDFMNVQRVLDKLVSRETVTKKGIEFQIERTATDGILKKKISFSDGDKNFEFCEKVQMFGLNDFQKMLSETGFEIKSVSGDYNLGKFVAAESERLILTAEKMEN